MLSIFDLEPGIRPARGPLAAPGTQFDAEQAAGSAFVAVSRGPQAGQKPRGCEAAGEKIADARRSVPR